MTVSVNLLTYFHWTASINIEVHGEYGHRRKLLVADMHRAQTTGDIEQLLEKDCHTEIALVPPGA